MKIQYCSDLHLEFLSNWNWLKSNPIKQIGEILLIAGDTYYLGKDFTNHRFFDFASENFKMVFLIPGNHEFYGGYDAKLCLQENYELKIRDNVFLVNNTTKEIDNVKFIFSSLWSKIVNEVVPILRRLNDFRLINLNNQKLTLDGYNLMFEKSWEFLQREITSKSEKQKVVVTHHLPSYYCNIEIYKNSILNEAFCIDLTDHINQSDIKYWIYGHSHGNKEQFKIGGTTMITNQLGYLDAGGEEYFKNDAYFELNSD